LCRFARIRIAMSPIRPLRTFLTIDPAADMAVLRSLASPLRIRILQLLQAEQRLNVNQISHALGLPQSTVATNIQMLEAAGLVRTEAQKASKGQQKICTICFDEVVIRLAGHSPPQPSDVVEVAMPLGLYTSCQVTAPCGLCSTKGVIGLLDVPQAFLDPRRMQAALLWFERGYIEYKFPNNAKVAQAEVRAIEFSLELSSEVPGTNANWPSDISLWVNAVKIGSWTSPGDFGDRRGAYTPPWWKLEGSQYGTLTTWRVAQNGTFVNGVPISDVTVAQLDLGAHHSIRLRIGVDEAAEHPGGVNIFGRGFGNHDQDIVMRLLLDRADEKIRNPDTYQLQLTG
jgi:predicted transcriptional regulator